MKTKNVFNVSIPARADDPVRIRILEAATGFFIRFGYSKVSMDEIARELRMSKATLYKVFRDKDDLLRAIVNRHLNEIEEGAENIIRDESKDFTGRMFDFLTFINAQISKMGENFPRDLQVCRPKIWEVIDRFRTERIFPKLKRLIEAGMREEIFRKDLNIELFFQLITAIIRQVMNPVLLMKLGITIPKALEMMQCFWFEGILTDKARKLFQETKKSVRKKNFRQRGDHETDRK